jgi:hypothetical protein
MLVRHKKLLTWLQNYINRQNKGRLSDLILNSVELKLENSRFMVGLEYTLPLLPSLVAHTNYSPVVLTWRMPGWLGGPRESRRWWDLGFNLRVQKPSTIAQLMYFHFPTTGSR